MEEQLQCEHVKKKETMKITIIKQASKALHDNVIRRSPSIMDSVCRPKEIERRRKGGRMSAIEGGRDRWKEREMEGKRKRERKKKEGRWDEKERVSHTMIIPC